LHRIPTQYLIGEWPFRDTSLILKPPVFIPRPETEMLIDYVLESVCHIGKDNGVTFIDMGCGSGPICVSLLQENQQLRGWAIDVSPEAVNLTKQNAIRYDD
jgi:release factor glutamine methyltransferase